MATLQTSFTSIGINTRNSILGENLTSSISFDFKNTSYRPLLIEAKRKWDKKELLPSGKPVRRSMHVKTGDTVKIIGGKDKGKVSEIVRVNTFDSTVFVKDANLKTKHIKPQARGETGRIIQVEGPIHSSNVMLFSKESKVASRVGQKFLEDGSKVRFLIKTGEVIDDPSKRWEKRKSEKKEE